MPDKSTGDLGADGYHRYKVCISSAYIQNTVISLELF